MKPLPVGLQLYSVRDLVNNDFPALLARVADMGYAGVEFAGFHGMTAAELKPVVADLGLTVCSVHSAMPTPENIEQLISDAETLGYKWHISGFGPDDVATHSATMATAERARQAVELLAGTGISFAIHNHWWEFDKTFDGQTPHDILMSEVPGLCAQVDTYWVTAAGGDAASVIRELGARAPLLHIKDGPAKQGAPMTAVGQGKLDWQRILAETRPESTEWLIVELDACATDMMQAVAESYRFLVDQGFGRGK